ncbi:hypothetical protein ACLKA6_013814 [Drosophila palustris]
MAPAGFTVEYSKDDSEEERQSPKVVPAGVDFIPNVDFQMKMPSFRYVGSMAKQCLYRGYDVGIWHFECTTQSDKISVYSIGEANPDLKHVTGGVGIREKFGALNLTQAWQSNGYLGMIGACTQAFGAFVYALVRGTYGPKEDASAKIDLLAGFERSPIKSEVIIPILKSPKFLGYLLVEPIEHFVLACRMEFNIEERAIDAHAFCIGYSDETTEYGLKLENFKDVRGSVFQRLGDKWGVALKANLFGKDMKKFTVGGQYQINEKAMIKARICDTGLTGLVYQIKLNDNVEGNYYFGFDATSPLKGEHKIGIAWRFRG